MTFGVILLQTNPVRGERMRRKIMDFLRDNEAGEGDTDPFFVMQPFFFPQESYSSKLAQKRGFVRLG